MGKGQNDDHQKKMRKEKSAPETGTFCLLHHTKEHWKEECNFTSIRIDYESVARTVHSTYQLR